MPRFSANLQMLFTELPFRARFSAARLAGFSHVDLLFPEDGDIGQAAAELSVNDLTLQTINVAAGDRASGDFGLACRPGYEAAFESAIDQGLAVATTLGSQHINVMVGKLDPHVRPEDAFRTLIGNLTRACEAAAEHGLTVLIEPLNTRDHPGYFLSRTDDALRIAEAVATPNLKLLLDLYHRQIMEGDLAQALYACMESIGHIQIANPPLRGRPDHGEINFAFLFDLIEELGYQGLIGCAFKPDGPTRENLAWIARYKSDQHSPALAES